MVVGEIERRVPEDRLVQPGFPVQFRTEDADRLQVGAAVQMGFELAEEGADVADIVLEASGTVLALHGMHLVPEIPGKQRAGAAPAFGGEGEAGLDEAADARVGHQLRALRAGTAIGLVERVDVPADPLEIRVERGQKNAQACLCGKGEQVIPKLDHRRVVVAGRLFEEMGAGFGVFEHQAQARDAMKRQPSEVAPDGWQVLPIDQAAQFMPADGVVIGTSRRWLCGFGET